MDNNTHYLLLTPGPLTTSSTVRQAMLRDWCTWDDDYNKGVVTKIRSRLLDMAVGSNTDEYTTVLLQGSGTYSVEATIGSSISDNSKLLILANGAYGKRMAQIADYLRINYTLIELLETEQLSAQLMADALEADRSITHVSFVHCETTTGILNPLTELAHEVKSRGKVLIVDAMSSFGGIEIDMHKLGIDFLISSANKCVQGVPGFGFVIARRSELLKCKGVSRSLSLDMYDQWETMENGGGKWRFTSPTHVVRAFAQALTELEEEGGIAARNRRYTENHRTLVEGMRSLGFETLLDDSLQSPIITSFLYPSIDFSFKNLYEKLKGEGFVIYPGKISNAETFRIGNIGDVHPADFTRLIEALERVK